MNRTRTALATATFLVAATATPAQAATVKSPLVGPGAHVTCANPGEEAWDGEHINDLGPGQVAMKIKNGKVTTKIVLKRALPRTTYVMSLIQGEADCHTVDAKVRTDKRGNVTIKHTERRTGHAAQTLIYAVGYHDDEHTWRASHALKLYP